MNDNRIRLVPAMKKETPVLMTFKYDRKDFDCNYGDEADDQFALVFIVPEAIDRNAPAGSDMSFVKFDDCANIRREIVRDIHAGEVRRADDVRIALRQVPGLADVIQAHQFHHEVMHARQARFDKGQAVVPRVDVKEIGLERL